MEYTLCTLLRFKDAIHGTIQITPYCAFPFLSKSSYFLFLIFYNIEKKKTATVEDIAGYRINMTTMDVSQIYLQLLGGEDKTMYIK